MYFNVFPGDADVVINPGYLLARPRSRQPSRTTSMPATPLRRLESFKESIVDELNEENMGYTLSNRSSSSTCSRLSAPHRRVHHRNREYKPEEEEQQNVSPPTVWSPEPPEQGSGEARNPLLQRPQWKPQDQRGQPK